MKFLIASDLHGSYYYAKKLLEAIEREGAEKVILLGDIYNHGPRNPLPGEYSPMQVASALNEIKDKLIVIKGNCDSVVDTMISQFDFLDSVVLVSGGKTVFLTHGHVFNKDSMPKTNYSAVIYGHFHTCFIDEINGVTIANAGSLSLPKQNTNHSYLVLEEGVLTLKDISGEVLKEKKL